jgi:hypothetical protein
LLFRAISSTFFVKWCLPKLTMKLLWQINQYKKWMSPSLAPQQQPFSLSVLPLSFPTLLSPYKFSLLVYVSGRASINYLNPETSHHNL